MADLPEVLDCIILGGGPAGLSAALYMGRYLRPTLVLNHPTPATRWHRPTAHNVLGYPAGIQRNQLLEWGRCHVGLYPSVQILGAVVNEVFHDGKTFVVQCSGGGAYRARGMIIASGIEHPLPDIPEIVHYAGKNIWHCPECDGAKCVGKAIVVLGHGRGSADMALELSIWTNQITLCCNGVTPELDAECLLKLRNASIEVKGAKVEKILGDPATGVLTGFGLEDGSVVAASGAFVNGTPDGSVELFARLPLELQDGRWIKVDHRMRTNIARLYAAGDIVAHAQTQLAVAMGTGATAAIWLHRELLPPEMCLSDRKW